MYRLRQYILEKFQVSKDNIKTYAYQPKDKDELVDCIKEKIEKEGLGTKKIPLDLNDIDTSKIIDMSNLFDPYDGELRDLSKTGYFDISEWDVSNVKDMSSMFYSSHFNGDISDWDVSNVEDMHWMFSYSLFNNNIADWDVSNVKDMSYMFSHSIFNGQNYYFELIYWNVNNNANMKHMFDYCPLQKNPPKWYNA